MSTGVASPDKLLRAAYRDLGLAEGNLADATDRPDRDGRDDWLNQGEWLALAKRVHAEKVFFVDSNPVFVFAQTEDANPEATRRLFNDAWCMARPQCLFLATPGELAVYDLTRSPVRPGESLEGQERLLARARSVPEVQSKLQAYRREQVESGRLFAERRFGAGKSARADQALVRDLNTVRELLIDAGLKPKYAHALIGRSIFVRYLEDRGILLEEDFRLVARQVAGWTKLLKQVPSRPDADPEMSRRLYPRVLANKDFTYALFRKLAADFNGDMFPADPAEERAVKQKHLRLLQGFLRGDPDPNRPQLFFFAYRFDVIPIELISSIYEAFYNKEKGATGNNRSHYTPSALVEFILSSVLTPERLAGHPRIADVACGSGIFLVEAFRRIVRYRWQKKGARLGLLELRKILRDQIRGIEINGEAVRVAAFSLYLALLHYLDPPDIWRDKRLPYLKYDPDARSNGNQRFDILLEANAFPKKGAVPDATVRKQFGGGSVDIVVGNPPWGYPPPNDTEGRPATDVALDWCKRHDKPVGDKEPSQAFIHRSLDLLRGGGCAGMLVSAGVLHNQGDESERFREAWLSSAQLVTVVNFTHVRHLFFSGTGRKKGAIAPFAAVMFEKADRPDHTRRFEYWSAKRTPMASRLRAVVLSRSDLCVLPQDERTRHGAFWKTYWWGNHRDDAFLQALDLGPSLESVSDSDGRLLKGSGRCFMKGGGADKPKDHGWPSEWKMLPTQKFDRYARLRDQDLEEIPPKVARPRDRWLYEGSRILVKQSPSADGNGRIIARFESTPLVVRHSIYSFRFRDSATWEPKIILGILWSSLARYYLFLKSGSWGTWHDKISLDEMRSLPIRLPEDQSLRDRILPIVEQLRSIDDVHGRDPTLFSAGVAELERQLDEAVFDLYELTEAERDLVRDMCDIGLDLYYNHEGSDAAKPVVPDRPKQRAGTVSDLPTDEQGLEGYLRAFLGMWNREVQPDGEFRWQVIRPATNAPLLGVVFSTQYKDSPLPPLTDSDEAEWSSLLHRLNEGILTNWERSRFYIDGLVREVTDTDCIIIKRNERRHWTRSAAREDAEAALLQALRLQQATRGARE
ncbi:MAG TPA: N-6 DNA methylase [Phycisphaerae bacterium]|nr:N-6 DNA methylase [Phycisphaerae bacterium]